jgi:DNA-binding transcriptional ArsR family regulator
MDEPIIQWDSGTGYDLFASLKVIFEPEAFSVRPAWAAGRRARLPAAVRESLDRIIPVMNTWLNFVSTYPGAHDARSILNALTMMTPLDRVRALCGFHQIQPTLDAVAHRGSWVEADLAAVLDATTDADKGFGRAKAAAVLAVWAAAERNGTDLLAALREYYDLCFAEEERRIAPALSHALEAAQQRARELPLPALMEELSRGLQLDDLLDMPIILLVPCYWTTPIVIFGRNPPDTRIMLFGARRIDEALAPGELAPDTLVDALKALADPARLAILRYLARASLQPAQLAVRLDLRPATVSHHLKVLRLAGLVRVTVRKGNENIYAARLEAVSDVFVALIGFVEPGM